MISLSTTVIISFEKKGKTTLNTHPWIEISVELSTENIFTN
jgi:hypothetical protein